MPITFLCSCGQSMTVRDEFAGKQGLCPRCKQPILVPMASAPQAAPPMPPMSGMPAPMPGAPMPGAPRLAPPPGGPATPRAMPRPPIPAPANPGTTRTGPMPAVPPMAAPPRPTGSTPRPVPQAAAPAAAPARPGTRPGGKPLAKLHIVSGPPGTAGKIYPLTPGKPHVIGRDPHADVPIPSERISRRHCQLEPTEDGLFVLADLGSSNGTLVNQERVAGRKVLLGGEYIQVGDVLLRFADS